MIRLVHAKHGVKFAYIEAEAVADEKNGWRREESAPVVIRNIVEPPHEALDAIDAEDVHQNFAPIVPRRGRPPKVR